MKRYMRWAAALVVVVGVVPPVAVAAFSPGNYSGRSQRASDGRIQATSIRFTVSRGKITKLTFRYAVRCTPSDPESGRTPRTERGTATYAGSIRVNRRNGFFLLYNRPGRATTSSDAPANAASIFFRGNLRGRGATGTINLGYGEGLEGEDGYDFNCGDGIPARFTARRR